METKKFPGNERATPDSGAYLASERVRQGGFASHPPGMARPAHGFVEALVRWACTALRASPHPAHGGCHVAALTDGRLEP